MSWKFESSHIEEMLSSNCTWEQYADILNAKLAEWIAASPRLSGLKDRESGLWIYSEQPSVGDTHMAHIICIEPIVRDTAESLLRELIRAKGKDDSDIILSEVIVRAQRLLEKK